MFFCIISIIYLRFTLLFQIAVMSCFFESRGRHLSGIVQLRVELSVNLILEESSVVFLGFSLFDSMSGSVFLKHSTVVKLAFLDVNLLSFLLFLAQSHNSRILRTLGRRSKIHCICDDRIDLFVLKSTVLLSLEFENKARSRISKIGVARMPFQRIIQKHGIRLFRNTPLWEHSDFIRSHTRLYIVVLQ